MSEKDDSFAALFEASQSASNDLSIGSAINAEVISIGPEEVFLSVGSHLDGVLPKKSLQQEVNIGDRLDVQVVRLTEDSILLRLKNSSSSTEVDSLEDAFDMEIPVEGLVTEEVKGGFRVKVQGIQAFCPISQMDNKRIENGAPYLGKKYEFIITQYEQKNLVVSRRKVLDLQKAEVEGEFIKNIKVGEIVPAVVSRIESYGVFATINDHIEGLVHISELSWTRVKSPHDVLALNDKIQVKILKVEEESDRLKVALSIKQAGAEDPWSVIDNNYHVGKVIDGNVEKRAPFGLFVSLNDGINGLLPKSMWRESVDSKMYDNIKVGSPIKVRVVQINSDERKMTLGLPEGDDADNSWREHMDSQSTKPSMGTFADLFNKK